MALTRESQEAKGSTFNGQSKARIKQRWIDRWRKRDRALLDVLPTACVQWRERHGCNLTPAQRKIVDKLDDVHSELRTFHGRPLEFDDSNPPKPLIPVDLLELQHEMDALVMRASRNHLADYPIAMLWIRALQALGQTGVLRGGRRRREEHPEAVTARGPLRPIPKSFKNIKERAEHGESRSAVLRALQASGAFDKRMTYQAFHKFLTKHGLQQFFKRHHRKRPPSN